MARTSMARHEHGMARHELSWHGANMARHGTTNAWHDEGMARHGTARQQGTYDTARHVRRESHANEFDTIFAWIMQHPPKK